MKFDKSNVEERICKKEIIKKTIGQYNFIGYGMQYNDVYNHFFYEIILNDTLFITENEADYVFYGKDFLFLFHYYRFERFNYLYKRFEEEIYGIDMFNYLEIIFKRPRNLSFDYYLNVEIQKILNIFKDSRKLIKNDFLSNYKKDIFITKDKMVYDYFEFVALDINSSQHKNDEISEDFIDGEYYKIHNQVRPGFIKFKKRYFKRFRVNKLLKEIKKKVYYSYYNEEIKGIYLYFEGFYILIGHKFTQDSKIVKNIMGSKKHIEIDINVLIDASRKGKKYKSTSYREIIYYINKVLKKTKHMNVSIEEIKELTKGHCYINENYDERIEEKLTPKTDLFMTKDEFRLNFKKENVLVKGFFDEINYYYYDLINKHANYVSFKSDGIDHSFMLYSDKCILEIRFNRGYNLFIYYKDNDKLVFKPIGDYLYDYISREKRVIYWASELMKKEDIIFNVGNEIKELVVPYCYIKDEEKEELIKYLK